MRKIVLVLLVAAFIGSFCFIHPSSTMADEAKTITGKIESVSRQMGKPPKWTYAKLTVVADSGEKAVIYVLKATAVTDVSGNDMCEGGKKMGAWYLKKGERVEVSYSLAANGRNEAVSIRCLE